MVQGCSTVSSMACQAQNRRNPSDCVHHNQSKPQGCLPANILSCKRDVLRCLIEELTQGPLSRLQGHSRVLGALQGGL